MSRRARRGAAGPVARHGRLPRSRPVLVVLTSVLIVAAVVVVSGVTVVGVALTKLHSSIKTVAIESDIEGPPPDIGAMPGGFTILLVGSDTRLDQGGLGGPDDGDNLNDVNILLHVSHDHTSAVAVSLPRDLIVPVPQCTSPTTGSKLSALSAAPINTTLYRGGLSCVVDTVTALTGIDIQFAGLITFRGVVELSNAVGGVPVCTTAPIVDRRSGLDLPTAGEHMLQGEQALAFLRTRHGVGDGSDLGRISSQQVFLSSLVRTLRSSDTLGDLRTVYEIATVATRNMVLSQNFSRLDTLAAIALAIKDIPLDRVVFVQYPVANAPFDVNRVVPISSAARALDQHIVDDEPFVLGPDSLRAGAVPDPDAPPSPTSSAPASTPGPSETGPDDGTGTPVPSSTIDTIPGLKGQTAADRTCSEAN